MFGTRSVRLRPRSRLWLGLALAAVVTISGGVAIAASGTPQTSYSFFTTTNTSQAVLDPDTRPVELGLRFRTSAAGTIDAVRFLQVPGDRGRHRVSVWSAGGTLLASATVSATGGGGWRQAKLDNRVKAKAGSTYVVSYHAARYRSTQNFFTTTPVVAGPMTALGSVYAYGPRPAFPTTTQHASNYWADLVFTTAAGGSTQSPSPSASPSRSSATATASSSSTSTSGPTRSSSSSSAGGTLQLPRVAWEGGPGFYGNYSTMAAWNNPSFFPLGVWYESVVDEGDAPKDKAAGLNTYVELVPSADAAALIRKNGMYALPSGLPNEGSETVGRLLTDEADMIYGAGSDPWSGKEGWNTCTPLQDNGGKCGYTMMQAMNDQARKDNRPRYANYGKGVTMWQSDKEAEVFINKYQQLVSADMYYYTDANLCEGGEAERWLGVPNDKCRRASSYGITMDRLRQLDGMDGTRIPIYAFVEVGHPFTESNSRTISADQIAGAVMNSIIHEARGVIYFNHNFGGSCISQHVLRDSCGAAVRPKVTETNQRLTQLAPVLNTQSYQFAASSVLDTMLKYYNGSYYLFAMPGRTGGEGGSQALALPGGLKASSAEVMFESRTVPIRNGSLTDTFENEYSYHIYKITP